MSRARVRLRRLADEAGLDYEEALVLLWDAGLESVEGPSDFVPRNSLSRARKALGLHPSKVLPHAYRQHQPAVQDIQPARHGQVRQPDWYTIGVPEDTVLLTSDDVLAVHEALVRDFKRSNDPISPPGLRSRDLLDSAVFRPATALGQVRKYPSIAMAGAALFHSLALNHAFHNGNKRTALVSLLVYLEANTKFLEVTQPQLYRYVLEIASHRLVPAGPDRADREVLAIAEWLAPRLGNVYRGEKVLRFGQMRRILASYGCKIQVLPGNRALITRPGVAPRWFGRTRLRSHVWYGDEGREVELNTIRKVRRELWLDEEHGVDSSRFYEARPGIDEFIAMYRKTLRQLART